MALLVEKQAREKLAENSNKDVQLYEDYYMSRYLICAICGREFEKWNTVSEHVLRTGHNSFDAGGQTHHFPKAPATQFKKA